MDVRGKESRNILKTFNLKKKATIVSIIMTKTLICNIVSRASDGSGYQKLGFWVPGINPRNGLNTN